jgi:hypothetical protein
MPKLSTDLRDTVVAAFNSLASCDIYSGSIPATGDTSPTGTLLVSFGGTLVWGSPSSGEMDLTVPLTSDTAVATGTAGYAKLSDGSTSVMYVPVATSGTDIVISSTSIVSGTTVDITAFNITFPAS